MTNARLSIDGRRAFLTFKNASLAEAAMDMKGVELGGTTLTFTRPLGYFASDAMREKAEKARALMRDLIRSEADAISNRAAQEHTSSTHGGANFNTATMSSRVVRLANIVSAEAFADDDEYREIVEDIEEECARCGAIERMVVPKPSDSHASRAAFVGDALICFFDETSAGVAVKRMHNREFDGNVIVASRVDESVFRNLLK
jgi:splicing factor U2AF subunit